MTQAKALTFDSYSDMTWKGGWSFIHVLRDNVQVGAIQQKSGFLIGKSGWHVTTENAEMLHAVVVQHGTDADHRVLKSESGLSLRQAKASIRSAWDRKYPPRSWNRN